MQVPERQDLIATSPHSVRGWNLCVHWHEAYFLFLSSWHGCSSEGLPAIESLPVREATPEKKVNKQMPKENTGLIWQEVLPEKPLQYQIWYKLCLNFGLNTRNTSTFQVKPGIFQLTSARLILFAPIYNYIEFSFRKIKSRGTPRNFLTNFQCKSEF